jgi:hypothetical protein
MLFFVLILPIPARPPLMGAVVEDLAEYVIHEAT